MRYAISSGENLFHLLTKTEDETLCGLRVAPIIINRPAKTSTLYLTEIADSKRRVCARCAAVKADREENAA